MTPREIAETIVLREGGFADDPADKGGATKHGVSLRYARRIGLDLDGDQDVDADDIRLVEPPLAVDLFLEDFLQGPKIDTLPERLHAQLFDMAVHHGPPRAVMMLQRVLNEAAAAAPDALSYGTLDEDGVVGGVTRRAAREAEAAMGPYLSNALVQERKEFLTSIARADPSQHRFLGGWLKRAEVFKEAA